MLTSCFWEVVIMIKCDSCKELNTRVDDKGYPYGFECMKYGDSVNRDDFYSTKEFNGGSSDEWYVLIKV